MKYQYFLSVGNKLPGAEYNWAKNAEETLVNTAKTRLTNFKMVHVHACKWL